MRVLSARFTRGVGLKEHISFDRERIVLIQKVINVVDYVMAAAVNHAQRLFAVSVKKLYVLTLDSIISASHIIGYA